MSRRAAELLDHLYRHGIAFEGQRVVDLGTGTGALARLCARAGAVVTGVDPAAPMLEQAAALDRDAGVTVEYRVAAAESTGLPAGAFDVVTAGQCWHWFDPARATAEVRRLLRPGGRIVIAHFDWLPLPGNVVEATEELIRAANPDWHLGGGTGLHPRWLTDLRIAGFTGIETLSFDLDVPYPPQDWRGRIRASAGVGASLPPADVDRFDHALATVLTDRFPGPVLTVPHRAWAVVATSPAA